MEVVSVRDFITFYKAREEVGREEGVEGE